MKGRIRKTHLLASAGLLALAAATASSANAAPPRPRHRCTAGAGSISAPMRATDGAGTPSRMRPSGARPPPLTDINSKGFLGGFQAGANWQSGSWVGGLEIDLSASGIKGSSPTVVGGSHLGPLTAARPRRKPTSSNGSARLVRGSATWYCPTCCSTAPPGRPGPGSSRPRPDSVFESEAGTGSEAAVESESDASWRFGAVAGVGAETRLGDSNWLARLEYLHYDFGTSGNSFFGRLTSSPAAG